MRTGSGGVAGGRQRQHTSPRQRTRETSARASSLRTRCRLQAGQARVREYKRPSMVLAASEEVGGPSKTQTRLNAQCLQSFSSFCSLLLAAPSVHCLLHTTNHHPSSSSPPPFSSSPPHLHIIPSTSASSSLRPLRPSPSSTSFLAPLRLRFPHNQPPPWLR